MLLPALFATPPTRNRLHTWRAFSQLTGFFEETLHAVYARLVPLRRNWRGSGDFAMDMDVDIVAHRDRTSRFGQAREWLPLGYRVLLSVHSHWSLVDAATTVPVPALFGTRYRSAFWQLMRVCHFSCPELALRAALLVLRWM